MHIKVLASGCANCRTLEKRPVEAPRLLRLDAHIEEVTDFADIASYGVMSTPALVIDDDVVLAGRVPLVAELERILSAHPA